MINEIHGKKSNTCLETPWGILDLPSEGYKAYARPEALTISDSASCGARGTILKKRIFNQSLQMLIADKKYWVKSCSYDSPGIGDELTVKLDRERVYFFNDFEIEQ